jgi:4'-phosphopantetheinyl transferase
MQGSYPARCQAGTIGAVTVSSLRTRALAALPPIARAETLTALPGRVDLWSFFYEETTDSALFDSYLALMTREERARHDRFMFERDRRQFAATRALVRSVLSHYVDVPPTDWRFAVGRRGKPYIEKPQLSTALHFNLSNTYGLVVCAVSTAHADIGVDAEALDRSGETVAIAEHYFAPLELKAMQALPEDKQRDRFFAYWTLKESYIKARGLGLAIPLEQFSFLIDKSDGQSGDRAALRSGGRSDDPFGDRSTIGILFDPRLHDDPAAWRFALLDAPPRHLVAVAVKSQGAPLDLCGNCVIPRRAGKLDFEVAS